MAILFNVTEIDFQLSLDSSSYLDETWVIPVYKALSLPPIKTLSIKLRCVRTPAVYMPLYLFPTSLTAMLRGEP